MLEVGLASFYALMFGALCLMAVHRGVTVWTILGESFRNITRGMETVFAALGLMPKPAPRYQPLAPHTSPDTRLAAARAAYVQGRIDVEDFEVAVDRWLQLKP